MPVKELTFEAGKLELLQLLRLRHKRWIRPTELERELGQMGYYFRSMYQLKKALRQLVEEGHVKVEYFERGHFHYFAYKGIEPMTVNEWRIAHFLTPYEKDIE